MTTYSNVLPTAVYTTAGLKDLMNSMETLLTNAGFAKSAQTGELVIANVVYSSVVSTDYGWQVWYLNDSQHSTYPIYIKIDYWMSGTSQVGIRFVIGHAVDGSGNFTGYKYPTSGYKDLQNGAVAVWGTATNASKACSLDGYGALILAPNATAYQGVWLIVQREWDDSTGGIKTGGNWSMQYSSNNGTSHSIISVNRVNSTVVDWSALGAFPACFVPGGSSSTVSQNAGTTDIFRHYAAFPTYTRLGGSHTFHTSEITAWSTYSAKVLTGGTARTWLATTGLGWSAKASTSVHSLAILWE